MTKSELIGRVAARQSHLSSRVVEEAIKEILDCMVISLSELGRVEIRGFGSLSLHYRSPRCGRNPKTGEMVVLSGRHVPYFKPGKELRNRVNVCS